MNARSVLETSAAVFSLSYYLRKHSRRSTGISEFHWCRTWAEGDSAVSFGSFLFSQLYCAQYLVSWRIQSQGIVWVCGDFEVRISKKLQQVGGETFPPLCWHAPPLFTVLFLFQVTGRKVKTLLSTCVLLLLNSWAEKCAYLVFTLEKQIRAVLWAPESSVTY